jgi:hypothetical protein
MSFPRPSYALSFFTATAETGFSDATGNGRDIILSYGCKFNLAVQIAVQMQPARCPAFGHCVRPAILSASPVRGIDIEDAHDSRRIDIAASLLSKK